MRVCVYGTPLVMYRATAAPAKPASHILCANSGTGSHVWLRRRPVMETAEHPEVSLRSLLRSRVRDVRVHAPSFTVQYRGRPGGFIIYWTDGRTVGERTHSAIPSHPDSHSHSHYTRRQCQYLSIFRQHVPVQQSSAHPRPRVPVPVHAWLTAACPCPCPPAILLDVRPGAHGGQQPRPHGPAPGVRPRRRRPRPPSRHHRVYVPPPPSPASCPCCPCVPSLTCTHTDDGCLDLVVGR